MTTFAQVPTAEASPDFSTFFNDRSQFENVDYFPELCQYLLDHHSNPDNRAIKRGFLADVLNDINQGNFQPFMKDIKFSVNAEGKPMLIDGHHRLFAGSLAEKGFKCRSEFNCPTEYVTRLDTGNTRSAADILTMTKSDLQRPHEIVAIFNAHNKMFGRKGSKPPVEEVIGFYEQNREGMDLVMEALNGHDLGTDFFTQADGSQSINKSKGLKSVNIKAPLVYCYSLFPVETKEFVRQMVTQGAAAAHSGPERLQYCMTAGERRGLSRDTPMQIVFKTLTAFRLFLEGQSQKQLTAGKDIGKILRVLQRKAGTPELPIEEQAAA